MATAWRWLRGPSRIATDLAHLCARWLHRWRAPAPTWQPLARRERLPAPALLLAVYDLGKGRRPRFTLLFDANDPARYLALRLSEVPDGPDGICRFEHVSSVLTNLYEPNGRMRWSELPLHLQRIVVSTIEPALLAKRR